MKQFSCSSPAPVLRQWDCFYAARSPAPPRGILARVNKRKRIAWKTSKLLCHARSKPNEAVSRQRVGRRWKKWRLKWPPLVVRGTTPQLIEVNSGIIMAARVKKACVEWKNTPRRVINDIGKVAPQSATDHGCDSPSGRFIYGLPYHGWIQAIVSKLVRWKRSSRAQTHGKNMSKRCQSADGQSQQPIRYFWSATKTRTGYTEASLHNNCIIE